MSLNFRGELGRTPDSESILFVNFLTQNREFIGPALGILEARKNPVKSDQVEAQILRASLRYNEIKENEKYEEFAKVITSIYDGEPADIDRRRGQILELVWELVGTIDNESYSDKIRNCKIFNNNKELSPKDIDFVYFNQDKDTNFFEFIELHECKAGIRCRVTDPKDGDTIDKLQLMDKTEKIAQKEDIDCNLYVITYDYDERRTKRELQKLNLNSIRIITRQEIESLIV